MWFTWLYLFSPLKWKDWLKCLLALGFIEQDSGVASGDDNDEKLADMSSLEKSVGQTLKVKGKRDSWLGERKKEGERGEKKWLYTDRKYISPFSTRIFCLHLLGAFQAIQRLYSSLETNDVDYAC